MRAPIQVRRVSLQKLEGCAARRVNLIETAIVGPPNRDEQPTAVRVLFSQAGLPSGEHAPVNGGIELWLFAEFPGF